MNVKPPVKNPSNEDKLAARQELRAAMNQHLENLEELISFADQLRHDKKRKDADKTLKIIDKMIANYRLQDEITKKMIQELD